MNDKEKHDERLLSILRDHPEKEPPPVFTEQLRARLTDRSLKKKWRFPNFKTAIAICASITILLTLGFTFSTELQQAMNLTEKQPDTTPIVKDEDEQQATHEPDTEDPKAVFKLSKEEMNTYKSFKEDHDEEHLSSLSPVSIAKLHVQSRVDKDYETEYALYTKREEYVYWTLEQHLEDAKSSNVSPDAIRNAFAKLGKGEFELVEDKVGVIQFEGPEYDMRFRMIKGENDIWKVAFMPTQ
ncbi:hypothetical protein [Alkalihalobacillus sp. TS-13]|uniref:hypothetical protein n=1 Tax=Alkalihalobacillus sp. TS-13 TaxID=2842455 RepID=UPI001C874914|nr:hypothetical protein [Alkalihalobacillus sp. TS-13]